MIMQTQRTLRHQNHAAPGSARYLAENGVIALLGAPSQPSLIDLTHAR